MDQTTLRGGPVHDYNQAKRILAISFYYPPANNPRAVQVSRLLRHTKLPTVLVCAEYDQPNERMDQTQELQETANPRECLRVPYRETRFQQLSGRFAHRFDLLLMDKRPDRFVIWKPAVMRTLERWWRTSKTPPDAIVTFGSPMSDHLIGLELKRKFGLPWAAHFSDPWVDNIFKDFNWLTRSINVALEKKVMENADQLIFTSQETIDLVMAKYPLSLRQKTKVLPHAFEADLYAIPEYKQNREIIIRYIGDMYGQRTPRPLFRALLELQASEPNLLKDIRVEFVGSTHDLKLEEMGLADLPDGLVRFCPTVTYLESLALMADSDGLLVIDAPAEESVFLPSKLVDYIGAGRPVFGITPPGAASRLIMELGGWSSDPSDSESTRSTLKSFLQFVRDKKRGTGESWGRADVRHRFEAGAVGAVFDQMILEMCYSSDGIASDCAVEK